MKQQSRSFSSSKFLNITLILVFILSILFTNFTQIARAAGSQLNVVGRFLQDGDGKNIIMRGVNIPVYKSGYADDLNNVAAAVAATKTNVVRLEWWANPPSGTTQYTVANLDRAIQKYVDLGILPIVELHDLTFQYGHDTKTGSNSDGNSQAIFASTITNFWTRPDVLPILIKHQNHLVINMANEWGSSTYSDSTSTASNFIQNYTNAITAMRTAGINAPLIVDTPKGFEYQFILDNGQAILNADPQKNTMLSIHAYWAASDYSDININAVLTNIKNSGLPIILGEVSSNAYTTIPCDPIHYANLLTTANIDQIGYLMWAWYEDGQCGQYMNITVNNDGVTIPALANPGFGYNVLNGAGYGIDTAVPTTTKVVTASAVNTKVLTSGRAIATWPTGIPGGEKRPVLVFLPGWDGNGAVDAFVFPQSSIFVNEGYVTLAIGFDSSAQWVSDIDVKTKEGLDKLCADNSIPANCSAIALIGESYGGAQNYWVMEYLLAHEYHGGVGSKGRALAFLSQDAGYGAPGILNNSITGAFTRTGLANTSAYSVAMIENLGDTTFPVDDCTWGNCGARVLSDAHLARGDQNVFSICPSGGEHGTRGFAQWNEWVISAIKTMIHNKEGIATFTGYISPTLIVGNVCNNAVSAITTLVNSVLPTSRTAVVGNLVTIFNTVINAGSSTALGVTLSMNPQPAGFFSYQQTNCATNAIIGSANPSIDITPGAVACYVLSFTPSATFPATSVHIKAQANNTLATNLLTGINTWLLRSTASAGPDIIALTTTTDFHQMACSGANAFAVALSNVGAAATGDIIVTANTGSAMLPLSISIMETNPGTGAIIGDNILQSVGAGDNRTVGVFVSFNSCVNFDPAANRIFIEFRDVNNNVVGSTSTAVSTNR